MNDNQKKSIIAVTLLIETSPQSLPLGAACVASGIKNHPLTKNKFDITLKAVSCEDKGYESAKTAGTTTKYLADKICEGFSQAQKEPAFVLFSVYVWNRTELEKAALEIKSRFPSCVTIAGGPEVTANPASFSAFDFVTPGPGENAVPELIAAISKGDISAAPREATEETSESSAAKSKTSETSASSTSRERHAAAQEPAPETSKNSAVQGQPREISARSKIYLSPAGIPKAESLSSPYLDGTLDPALYGGALWELARGCPFKCSYCFESKGEQKIQFFPIERIEAELDLFAKKKIPQVFVLDPTYNASKKRALEILGMIAKKTPDTFYYFEARAEFIDRELARAFTKIPCALQFGLQSADENVLKLVHRTFNKKQFSKNIGILNQEGVIFGFDLIYGLPGDTLNGFRESLDYALSLYPNNLETFCLSVLPGTVLYDQAEELHLTWEAEPPYHVLKTDRYSPEDLKRAAELSASCTMFYNNGRAVPWFNSVTHFFHARPHDFLQDFSKWMKANNHPMPDPTIGSCYNFTEIRNFQISFIKDLCHKRNLDKFFKTIENIILINGAFSENSATGKTQKIELSYHPEDLLSEYAQDIRFFAQNAKPARYRITIEHGRWKMTK